MIDVGSGAGFPGIPLKIAAPALRMTLVESVGKKAGFCQHVIQILGLENISVLTARAEELGQASDHRQQYDWAVARAVAVLPVLRSDRRVGSSSAATSSNNNTGHSPVRRFIQATSASLSASTAVRAWPRDPNVPRSI